MKALITNDEILIENITPGTRYLKVNSIEIVEGIISDIHILAAIQFEGIEADSTRFATHGAGFYIETIPQLTDFYSYLSKYSHLVLKSFTIKIVNEPLAKIILDYDLAENENPQIDNKKLLEIQTAVK